MVITNEQLQLRSSGIGGSDAAAILGKSKWKTPLDIYIEKTTGERLEDNYQNDYTRWGTQLEPLVIKEFEKRTGLKCELKNETLKHKQYDYIFGHIDGFIPSENAALEVKTTFHYNKEWDWDMENTDYIPDEFLIQAAHYVEILHSLYGVNKIYITVAQFAGLRFADFCYHRDEKLGKMILKKEEIFWINNVLKRVPPKISTMEDALKLWKDTFASGVLITDEDTAHKVDYLRKLKIQISELEKAQKEITTDLCAKLQDKETLLDALGRPVASWKNQASKRFDVTAFKQEHPELYSQFIKTISTRVFRIKN